MKKLKMMLCGLLSLFYLSDAADGPKEIIIKKDAELKSVIADFQQSPSEINQKKIIASVVGIFDFQLMSLKALPKAAWDQSDSVSRSEYITEFKRMIENSSIKKLEIYKSDSANYILTQSTNDSATVTAIVWYKGKQTRLNYKMINIGQQWKVWDLIVDDMSTVRNYREQFKTILEGKTLAALTNILKAKADSYLKK
jgi:phospholipid transport system substrate-binding protein